MINLHSRIGRGVQHNVLSATHSDSLAASPVRGDLIIANSTPAWASVAGVANAVLQFTTGGDTAWTTAPRLANIADTGGTNRITLATASPHITLTGNVASFRMVASGQIQTTTGAARITIPTLGALTISASLTVTGNTLTVGSGVLTFGTNSISSNRGLIFSGVPQDSESIIDTGILSYTGTTTGYGLKGQRAYTGAGAITELIGLHFATLIGGDGSTTTSTGALIQIGSTLAGGSTATVTTARGLAIELFGTRWDGAQPTTVKGIEVNDIGDASLQPTNLYGIHILQQTAASTLTIPLYQAGSTGHNRLVAPTTIGADATPATSAILELQSTVGSLLLPRMTTTQRDALTAVDGMLIYNSTTGVVESREGGAWVNT